MCVCVYVCVCVERDGSAVFQSPHILSIPINVGKTQADSLLAILSPRYFPQVCLSCLHSQRSYTSSEPTWNYWMIVLPHLFPLEILSSLMKSKLEKGQVIIPKNRIFPFCFHLLIPSSLLWSEKKVHQRPMCLLEVQIMETYCVHD